MLPTARTVEELLSQLPRAEQIIVKRLRALVLECLPKAEEKLNFGAPYYTRNRMICFIWPPTLYWGSGRTAETQSKKGISFGFCQGNLMSNVDGVLLAEGRKQVYVMYIHHLKEIDEDLIRSLLFEAEMIDDSFAKKKRKK